MSARARSMTPDERRRAIVVATLPLVLREGRAVTTAQIAQAAKVAEGTIFRVFATKDEVIDAAIESAFDMEPYLQAIETLDGSGTLDEVVTRTAQLMIDRFTHVFRMFSLLGTQGAPPKRHPQDWAERVAAAHERLLTPHADELTLTPREVMRYVRLLAFSGSNPYITDGVTISAAQIATLVLDGSRRKAS